MVPEPSFGHMLLSRADQKCQSGITKFYERRECQFADKSPLQHTCAQVKGKSKITTAPSAQRVCGSLSATCTARSRTTCRVTDVLHAQPSCTVCKHHQGGDDSEGSVMVPPLDSGGDLTVGAWERCSSSCSTLHHCSHPGARRFTHDRHCHCTVSHESEAASRKQRNLTLDPRKIVGFTRTPFCELD